MTFQPLTPLLNWSRARRAERVIQHLNAKIRRECIGLEVIETLPNGKRVKAVIWDMSWEPSVIGADGLEGAWLVNVRYTDGNNVGGHSWTSANVLEITGKRYASADEAAPRADYLVRTGQYVEEVTL